MSETVTHQQLADKFDNQVKTCDDKLKQESEYRHELANNASARFAQLEEHIDTNHSKMLDKIEKILVYVTKNQSATEILSKGYKKLGDEFTVHMHEETEDRKELLTKLDEAKDSRVSKSLFGYAVAALVVLLGAGSSIIVYSLDAIIELEKSQVLMEAADEYQSARLTTIEELLSGAKVITK